MKKILQFAAALLVILLAAFFLVVPAVLDSLFNRVNRSTAAPLRKQRSRFMKTCASWICTPTLCCGDETCRNGTSEARWTYPVCLMEMSLLKCLPRSPRPRAGSTTSETTRVATTSFGLRFRNVGHPAHGEV